MWPFSETDGLSDALDRLTMPPYAIALAPGVFMALVPWYTIPFSGLSFDQILGHSLNQDVFPYCSVLLFIFGAFLALILFTLPVYADLL